MRKALWAVVVVVIGVTGVWLAWTPSGGAWAQSQSEAGRAEAGHYLALSSDSKAGHQQITVIDSQAGAMSVYHVDHTTGAITLKSVRNIEADLMLDEFNTESPLPREIRAMLEKR